MDELTKQLFDAVRSNNLKDVGQALKKGANINVKRGELEETPLHVAAAVGNEEMVEFLIAKGADVNMEDKNGNIPLHVAILTYCKRISKCIGKGNFYRMVAAEHRIIKLLMEKADVNARDNDGNTPLHRAAERSDIDIVKFLIKKVANVNAKNNGGDTPLRSAIKYGRKEIAKFLVENGADTIDPIDTILIVGITMLSIAYLAGAASFIFFGAADIMLGAAFVGLLVGALVGCIIVKTREKVIKEKIINDSGVFTAFKNVLIECLGFKSAGEQQQPGR